MRIHNPFVTGCFSVGGSKAVDFTDATGGVSGSFSGSFKGSITAGSVTEVLPSGTVSSSAQLADDISGSFTSVSSSISSRETTLEAASASFETNKATKGFSIAMSVAL